MYNNLISYLDGNSIAYLINISARELTSFKIGGNIDFVVYPRYSTQIIEIIKILKGDGIRYYVLGNGTNTYFSDNGFKGIIISTKRFNRISVDENYIIAKSGADIGRCALLACENSLTGFEFAYGIPGNVGGCVYMNASAFNGSISKITARSTVYDINSDKIIDISYDGHKFGIKHSVFMENKSLVILETAFMLQYGNKSDIRDKMEAYLEKRRNTQPLELPSAGSVFKRPKNAYASKLIDDLGLKGIKIGGAAVSERHAGFIVNTGYATARDVRDLVELIKSKVKNQYGILLEEEIIYIE